eukprot:2159860-Pyramimonas_sp.AAC.1
MLSGCAGGAAQAAIILVVTNGRLIMENLLKYGFNVGKISFWLAHPMRAVPLVYTWCVPPVFSGPTNPEPSPVQA